MKVTREIDVVVLRSPAGIWTAQTLEQRDIAAAGETREEALAGLERLLLQLMRDDLGRLPAASQRPVMRQLRLSVPVAVSGRLTSVEVSLLLVLQRESSAGLDDEERGAVVTLPQLGMSFYIRNPQDPDQLEALLLEYLREDYALEVRLEAMLPWTAPLTLIAGEVPTGVQGALAELTTITLRARPGQQAEPSALFGNEEGSTLETVGEALHTRMARKDAPRAYERRAEVELLGSYLAEQDERSVVLVGQPGAGKTAIVHELVGRLTRGEVAGMGKDVEVWQISGGRLMAGMRFLGQWQERLLKVIEEASDRGAILFAENLVELLEAAGSETYAQGIPGLLLPHILAGDVVLITEARPEQLAWAEQRHPSFVRALRRLPVEPMGAPQTDAVLERLGHKLGRQHNVRLEEPTRQKILELTARFRGQTVWPAPAVELAERMARTVKRDPTQPDAARTALLPEHAVEAWASITGMPRNLIDPSLSFRVDEVRRFFDQHIFDQPEAGEAMTDLVTVLRAGLNPPGRPLGSYLFLGPTGVGKTQTALTLARYLFGSSDRMLRFDMSEYQDPWAAGRLVGRVRGEGGELTRKLREQPFQVVLLDEIEKADSAVFDLLLQALGEGRLTDAYGQTVSLTSAVIIMTSNLGARGPSSLGFGSGSAATRRAAEVSHYRKAVEEFFRPEFLGRIDGIIPFRSLDEGTARKLVERALREAFEREGLVRRGIRARVEPDVVDYLMRIGFDARYGARPLRQAVENNITATLAAFIARESYAAKIGLVFRMIDGVPQLELEDV
jgi:ATP-dependent Clp protease ATP-binding subunit ClpC